MSIVVPIPLNSHLQQLLSQAHPMILNEASISRIIIALCTTTIACIRVVLKFNYYCTKSCTIISAL